MTKTEFQLGLALNSVYMNPNVLVELFAGLILTVCYQLESLSLKDSLSELEARERHVSVSLDTNLKVFFAASSNSVYELVYNIFRSRLALC